jgi:hypothetical protein
MFLKRRVRRKDGKEHVHYALCESLRVHSGRVVQRQVLHLGELNTTQTASWQRTLEIINEEDGTRLQRRLFTDRDGAAPVDAEDVVEVQLSSLRVRAPRRFGDCWAGCRLWRELGLDEFWSARLGGERGEVPWEKVLELLAVNRLLDPRSEFFVHEKWFPETAMDVLLDGDFAVAQKDRLYRCLDRLAAHKAALEAHLAARWKDLFNASFDVVLYDLTSTCFEGSAETIPKASRGAGLRARFDCRASPNPKKNKPPCSCNSAGPCPNNPRRESEPHPRPRTETPSAERFCVADLCHETHPASLTEGAADARNAKVWLMRASYKQLVAALRRYGRRRTILTAERHY